MAKTTEKSTPTEKADTTASTVHTVVERAAGMSDDVLKSVESGQRAAIDALRKFVETVDDALPGKDDHDHPSRREAVIDAALDMADRLVTTQSEFLRSVVHSADRTLRKTDD